MAQAITETGLPVLAEVGDEGAGAARLARQAVLVALGVAALTLAAKLKVPMWPVPITMGTFAVLSIGAAYGPRLGLTTILTYMGLGALGADVFANSSAESNGLAYMAGPTGGYLVGYVLATMALGALARRGWDRSVGTMALAMLVGNALIYVPGLAWLGHLFGWETSLLWDGMGKFLIADSAKLALAALLLPALWGVVGRARG